MIDTVKPATGAYTNGTGKHHEAEASPASADQGPPAPAEPEHLTDLGNCRRFARLHGRDLRYTSALGWMVWDGKRWGRDETGQVMRLAKKTVVGFYGEAATLTKRAADYAAAAEKAVEAEDKGKAEALLKKQAETLKQAKTLQAWARDCQFRSRLEAMIFLARSEPEIAVRASDFDNDPWLLNVENGTIDLRNGQLRKHQRTDLLTKLAPVVYDAEAGCPTWHKFLNRIFEGNQEMIESVQRAAGYSLTAATTEHVLFFAHGRGQNGKSTFFETLAYVMGDYCQKAPTEMIMIRDRGNAVPNDVARLAGARMVVCAEVEEGQRLAESKVKDLTGGDTLTARFLHHDYFDFRPTHKLWLYGNHKPTINGTDTGIWRRINLIPFLVTIPPDEKDPQLPAKLKAEGAGILAWMVQGCLDWQSGGLLCPAAVKLATEEYRAESDTLGAFLAECCLIDPRARAQAGKLYKAYQAWCTQYGEKIMNSTRFGRQLVERGFTKGRSNIVIYEGIGLLAENSDE